MIYIIKQEGLYQNKVNSGLVFTCNCEMAIKTSIVVSVFLCHICTPCVQHQLKFLILYHLVANLCPFSLKLLWASLFNLLKYSLHLDKYPHS